jgi:hypothetical protein
MIVASTIVPARISRPLSARCALISSNNALTPHGTCDAAMKLAFGSLTSAANDAANFA